MLVIISMDAPGMVDVPIFLHLFDVAVSLSNDSPACLGNDPEWSDTLVLREMVTFRHILVPEVDFNVGHVLRAIKDLLVQTLKLSDLLWS